MHFGLSSGLTDPTVINSQHSTSPQVFAMLGQRDGFAIDFVAKQMLINDAANPSNQYRGGPEQKLTKWGDDGYVFDPVRGLEIDAARDFSIALDTSLFPYNPQACTIGWPEFPVREW